MRPVVIGIGGGTASGKSTVARALVDSLGPRGHLILHDHYYHAPLGDPATHNFDHPDALDTAALIADLDALRRGETRSIPRYDFQCHARLDETEALTPREVLVVEGILVLANEALRACFDRSIFVHTPADIRLMRRVRRDISERGRTVGSVFEQYARTVRPMHEQFVEPSRAHAEVEIDGTLATSVLVDQLWKHLGLDAQWRLDPDAGHETQ